MGFSSGNMTSKEKVPNSGIAGTVTEKLFPVGFTCIISVLTISLHNTRNCYSFTEKYQT
jgi:hypothetical protein